MPFSVKKFMSNTFIPCVIVSVLSFTVPLMVCYYMQTSLTRFFINIPLSLLWTICCCIVFGLTKSERKFLYEKILYIYSKVRK